MPSKIIQCEFCDQPFRKNVYGVHVKAKHVKDLAKLFLERCNNPLFNPIKSVTKSYKPENIPVYSQRHEFDCFFFGVKPQYFEKSDAYGPYIQNEANMKKHMEFLKEVINSIALTDFLTHFQAYPEKKQEICSCSVKSNMATLKDQLKLGGLTQPTLFRFETIHS
jgi:hypothetical protein